MNEEMQSGLIQDVRELDAVVMYASPTDGTDGDQKRTGDSDGTDAQDNDGTDAGDADGTDNTDTDGTDGDGDSDGTDNA